MKKLLLLVFLFPIISEAQSKKQRKAIEAQLKADQLVLNNLKAHVQYLADDKLEGRRAGSKGEELAKDYIANQFKILGLLPKGNKGYAQEFLIDEGKKVDSSTHFTINENNLQLNTDYTPLAYSANKAAIGSPALDLRESGEPWFADVKDWLENNKSNPHYDINVSVKKEAARVAAKGATALILYNSSKEVDNLSFNNRDSSAHVSIPVLFIKSEAFKKHCSDKSAILDIDLNVSIKPNKRTASNVVGLIDNGAASTVVIGAHYDHLGFGEDANALDTASIIHNGADDNASGTAAMIELARLLKVSPNKKNNYLFIAFSGEELGLYGSKYWLENPTTNTPINYMLNMDMVGRYDDARKLTIGGFGTSPIWANVLTSTTDKSLLIKFDTTGSGPSDHAAFYRKDIPVLFFFTGIHGDYHKATDDWDKVNYDGELKIVKFVHRLVEATDNQGKLAFTKTAEPQMGPTKFTVTLGVIPDYGYSGTGLRIDGVSPKKLAEKVGLQAGDVLLQLGDYKINEINSYMQALGSFKKGDTTTLKILRGTGEKSVAIEF
jgi:aminopeptidase YwaD